MFFCYQNWSDKSLMQFKDDDDDLCKGQSLRSPRNHLGSQHKHISGHGTCQRDNTDMSSLECCFLLVRVGY